MVRKKLGQPFSSGAKQSECLDLQLTIDCHHRADVALPLIVFEIRLVHSKADTFLADTRTSEDRTCDVRFTNKGLPHKEIMVAPC